MSLIVALFNIILTCLKSKNEIRWRGFACGELPSVGWLRRARKRLFSAPLVRICNPCHLLGYNSRPFLWHRLQIGAIEG
jgi:hypothetical protein